MTAWLAGMKIAGIVLNAVGMPAGLVAAGLLGVLGFMFLDSHVGSDQVAGVVTLVLGVVALAIPIVGIVFATRKKRWMRIASVVMGIAVLVVAALGLVVLPGAIEAVARL